MSVLEEARQAPVSVALFAANVAMFLWMWVSGIDAISPTTRDVLELGANSGAHVADGEWWRLLACMFLHGGLVHLIVNMWSLRILGPFVESLYGHATFGVIYVLAGAGGSIASCLWNPLGVSVGASGAIFGSLGAIIAFFLSHRRSLPTPVFRSMMQRIGLMLLLNLYLGFSIPQIDNAAHMGGLVTGIVCGFAAWRPARTPPVLGPTSLLRLAGVALVLAGLVLLVPRRVDAAIDTELQRRELPRPR